MIEVFKVASAQWLLILSMDMIYSTMEGIVPSRCRLTTRHLGATLFKLRLHASLMSLQACTMTLGGYQLLLSTIQASYIYTGAVISSNSVGLQNSASRLAKPTSHSTITGIMYLKNLVIYLRIFLDVLTSYMQTSYSAGRYNRGGT